MNILEVHYLLIIIYILIWAAVITGVLLITKSNSFAVKGRKWILEKRIQQFKYPPFNILIKFWIKKKYLMASSFFMLIIIPAAVMYFILGVLLLTPIISIYQGLVAGILIGSYRKSEMLWAITIGIFEFGYWALSGALGLSVSLKFILTDISFTASLLFCFDRILTFYWIPLAICILINAFGETAGPIYLNIHGPISLEALAGIKEN
jgi:hypothetical protein